MADDAQARGLTLPGPRRPPNGNNYWWTYLYGPDLLVSPVWEKGIREQQVYLPAGTRWRDAWQPERVHDGGQTITVPAETHQIPLFVREGSPLDLGNLEREWQDAQAIVRPRPDLAALERSVNDWFRRNGGQKSY